VPSSLLFVVRVSRLGVLAGMTAFHVLTLLTLVSQINVELWKNLAVKLV
jgi:hypothetical protein